jgi:hypothetical protein
LARSAAATGDPSLLVRSFGVNVALMLALDLIAIPLANLTGAALASVAGTTAGLAVCVLWYRNRQLPLGSLVPNRDDLRMVSGQFRGLLAQLRGA